MKKSKNVNTKVKYVKHSVILATYLLIVWGFYRFLFRFPEEVEELLIKPILWLIPVYYFVSKEKLGVKSVGITMKNMFPSIYLALGLGAIFVIEGVVINAIKHGAVSFNANVGQVAILSAFGISLATAISEEITFRGYLFTRVAYVTENDWVSNLITSLVWGLIHLPISIFWLDLSFAGVVGFFILTTVFGIGSAFIFSKTRNIASSILLHVLWTWPIILFR